MSTNDSISQQYQTIENLVAPIDYPYIEGKTKQKVKLLHNYIYLNFHFIPVRIAPSVEGGVAMVYRTQKNRFLKKDFFEVFIEIYNDDTYVISFLKNSDILMIDEVSGYDEEIIHKYFTTFPLIKLSRGS